MSQPLDSRGRTIWITDAHRDDGKRFVVRADEKLTAFVEVESAIRGSGELARQAGEFFRNSREHENEHSISSNYIFTRLLCAFAQSAGGRPAAGRRLSRTTTRQKGQNALLNLNVNNGANNTAVGWRALRTNVEGDFNTAIGSAALDYQHWRWKYGHWRRGTL